MHTYVNACAHCFMGVFRPARPHTAITTLSRDSVCIDAGMAVMLCVSLISAKVLKCVNDVNEKV